jgi:hypothetical protein
VRQFLLSFEGGQSIREGRDAVVSNASYSTTGGRWLNRDQVVALQESGHLAYRRPFDVEPFREGLAPALPNWCRAARVRN